MKITKENVSRKLDSLGRISIPKGIRDRMRLEVNEEMEFFSLIDDLAMTFSYNNKRDVF